MGIQEIEQAITSLTPKELARFRQWFEEFDAHGWDQQLEADAKSGKLDKIAEKAISEYHAGHAKEL
jgi:major membrane immunogen (membrane-anchored lipoprotein)